jgi:hypothetical protein
VLTRLERRYAAFDGLNLTWETIEGVVKHNGPVVRPRAEIAAWDRDHGLMLTLWPSLEAQVAAQADWNSSEVKLFPTIVSIEGDIAPGEKIKLKSTLDPKRTFKLKVKKFDAEKSLVWGDAMGKRMYTLTPDKNGSVNFSMVEKIGGPMFPLFANKIPSFDASFEQFAADLKKEAELIQQK